MTGVNVYPEIESASSLVWNRTTFLSFLAAVRFIMNINMQAHSTADAERERWLQLHGVKTTSCDVNAQVGFYTTTITSQAQPYLRDTQPP